MVPLNTSTGGLVPATTTFTGATSGWGQPETGTERIATGSINATWKTHMYLDASDVVPTASSADDTKLHTMDIVGLSAHTTYTFALAATNQVPKTAVRGDESHLVKTAHPNPPDAPSSVPAPTGFGPYFINLTWNTPFSDGKMIHLF